ncbi:MAG: tetratricopeptide repeat protein, partial [Dehalococcoidia bacterium]
FSFQLLEALGDVETDLLLDAIDEAERTQLITALEDGQEAHFTFAHELIRQTLVSGLSMPRRQRMHLRVAEGMEQVYVRDLEEHAADLAHHLYQAGAAADPDKTGGYLTQAGDHAMASTAFEDALRHYESALSLQADEERKARADLLYKRGSALRSLGRWDEAFADWREVLAICEELGDIDGVGHVSRELGWQLGWAYRLVEGLEVELHGLSILGDVVSADRCALMALAGNCMSMGGDRAGGDPMIARAMAMAQELGDERLLAEVLMNKAYHHFYYSQPQEMLDAGLRATDLLRSARDLWGLANVLWTPQTALLCLGRLDEVAEIGEELEPLADRVGHKGVLMTARRNRGIREFMLTADIDGFAEFARGDLELCRSADLPWIFFSYSFVGMAHFWRGNWRDALTSFEEAVGVDPSGVYAGTGWAKLFVGQAYAQNRSEALAILKEQRDNLPQPGQANPYGAWEMLGAAIEGLSVLGEREEAGALYPLILEETRTGAIMRWDGPRLLQTTAGIAAACGRQWEKAEEHYETALRQAHELPHKMEQPEVRRWYARMLIDRDGPGDRDRARELLTEALVMYRKIGMPKHIEMAEIMLGEVKV